MTPTLTSTVVSSSPPIPNRRAFPRRRAKGLARCRSANRPFNPGVRARLLDISQGEIGIVSSEPFTVATTLELELEPAAGNYRLVRLAEICWAHAEPDGTYRLGCCFAQRLTFAEMQRFV